MLLVSGISFSQEIIGGDVIEVQEESQQNDVKSGETVLSLDSLFIVLPNGDKEIKSLAPGMLGHSPHTATMYAAVLPGLGQIYNKKYWKLPILYGGIAALCYSIHFNGKYYDIYRNAYRDFIIGDPNNTSYRKIISEKTTLSFEDVENNGRYASWFQNVLKNKKDYYRRYRDLSYFGLIGVYVIQMVDAAVDAHFFKFDVNDDLSLQWQPTVVPDNGGNVGASLCITF